MKLKKIPRQLALWLLTAGASLILGFLSFGGMFVLWPVLPLAFTAFALSVGYEGEVYLQNINGALQKLFNYKHLERRLANDYLLEHFPDTNDKDCPQFFKDYEAQLNFLHQFSHKRLTEKSAADKKQVEKTLRDMEKWFASQLFASNQDDAPYTIELQIWLAKSENQQAAQQLLLNERRNTFWWLKAFSALAGTFMSLGTTYLLVEAFSNIPFFAAIATTTWPLLIVPMAVIAGTAYGLLTYNAITDMVANKTLQKWNLKIREDYKKGHWFIPATAVVLGTLAFALTFCTAGTWWTVAKETRPLFTWMGKMPGFIMGIINPIIIGLSAIVFNLQNTSKSLELIEGFSLKKFSMSKFLASIKKGFDNLQTREHPLQIINPFRLLLKITVLPLRILLFMGHLISIGVTTDRVPGISEFFSALLGIISEGFEDAHYFVDHNHNHVDDHEHGHGHGHGHGHKCETESDSAQLAIEMRRRNALLKERLGADHGHSHEVDIPTRFLKFVFSPLYFLAAGWDYLTSKLSSNPLSFNRAWDKQHGLPIEEEVKLGCSLISMASAPKDFKSLALPAGFSAYYVQVENDSNQLYYIDRTAKSIKKLPISESMSASELLRIKKDQSLSTDDLTKISSLTGHFYQPSEKWKMAHVIDRIDRYKEKHLEHAKFDPSLAKEKSKALIDFQQKLRRGEQNIATYKAVIKEEKDVPVYSKHRFFDNGLTQTQQFIEDELIRRTGLGA